jgi:hypothetical protein
LSLLRNGNGQVVPENDMLPAILSGFCYAVKMFGLIVALKARESVVIGGSSLREQRLETGDLVG